MRHSMQESLRQMASTLPSSAAGRAGWRVRMNWQSSVTRSQFLKHKRVQAVSSSTGFHRSNLKRESSNVASIYCAGAEWRSDAVVTVGGDIPFSSLRENFDAVYLAIGAQKPKELEIPGADLRGVFHALPFLIQKNLGTSDESAIDVRGKRVAVLGGGDTAMDCLRTAIRCGAHEAICIYRRDLENMPGSRREYINATEEGARFMFLTNAVSLSGNAAGEVCEARCVRMELGEPDAKGRRKPRPISGSEFTVSVDAVLIAYGFDPVPIFAAGNSDKIEVNKWSGVIVDENQMTSVPGVFAGGDLVRGPDLVVRAVRDSRKAAAGIHRYLSSQTQV